MKIFQDKSRMGTIHKLKIFISNNIIINFTLNEISTPLSVVRVSQPKTYQKAWRETTYVSNCRQPSKLQRGEPCVECAAGGPPPKRVSEWIFMNNIMFYDYKNKILV